MDSDDTESSWHPESESDVAVMSPDATMDPSESEDWNSGSSSDGGGVDRMSSNDEPHFLLYLLKGCFDGCCTTGGCQMKELVWSRLPTELVERVLGMLPAASRCRFRSVCKAWRAFLSSGAACWKMSGTEARGKAAAPICALEYFPGRWSRFGRLASDVSYLARQDATAAAAAGLGKPQVSYLCKPPKVYRLDLSFLPRQFQHFSQYRAEDGLICIQKYKRRRSVSDAHDPGGGAGGGDCLSLDSDSEAWSEERKVCGLTFCVCNPLTRAWKELPAEFGEEDDVEEEERHLKLVVDKARVDSFKLIVISDRPYQGDRWDKRCTASIYYSDTDRWKVVCLEDGGGLLLDPDDHRRWPQFVLCKDVMFSAFDYDHFLVHCLDDGRRLRSSPQMAAEHPDFDERRAAWHYSIGRVFRILEHGGEIYCVDESLDRRKMKFGVWKLDQSVLLWQPVSVVPEKVNRRSLRPFCGEHDEGCSSEYRYFLYGAWMVGDCICLNIGVMSPRKKRLWSHLVAYHILDDSWQLLWHQLDYHHSANNYLILQPRI